MTILSFVKEAQELLRSTPSVMDASYFDFFTYLAEFKTIGLGLPRRSGKTTAAKQLHREQSSLLYHNHSIGEGFNLDREVTRFRGMKLYGFKANVIIFDEYRENPPGFEQLIHTLAIAGALSRDFHIVRLYT